MVFGRRQKYLVGDPLQSDVSMSGKLVVHLEGERRLLQELLKVLSAALVLEPVDVVAIGGDLQTIGRR